MEHAIKEVLSEKQEELSKLADIVADYKKVYGGSLRQALLMRPPIMLSDINNTGVRQHRRQKSRSAPIAPILPEPIWQIIFDNLDSLSRAQLGLVSRAMLKLYYNNYLAPPGIVQKDGRTSYKSSDGQIKIEAAINAPANTGRSVKLIYGRNKLSMLKWPAGNIYTLAAATRAVLKGKLQLKNLRQFGTTFVIDSNIFCLECKQMCRSLGLSILRECSACSPEHVGPIVVYDEIYQKKYILDSPAARNRFILAIDYREEYIRDYV